jgi:NADP-dependent aldehyde dehydrogenase
MLQGKHLIAGKWVAGETTFTSQPASGDAHEFAVGTPELVDEACKVAEEAFWFYGYSTRAQRAEFLNRIADEIDARGDEITRIGAQETGLPEARLVGERGRTVSQLRLFANHILTGDYLDRRHDPALNDRQPLPRPDLHLLQRPVGPVAVFGASNFPLAFSVAGGDTAAALAAGCPVVVKGHSAHPGTSDLVAQALHAAIKACDIHPGVVNLVQGGRRDVGTSLVEHPLIKAVGFTGSTSGGRALFDLCAKRPEPIPFFGELGSVNPMFLLPGAVAERGKEIAEGWAASLTLGAGQFCTNPGVAVLIEGTDAERFAKTAAEALSRVGEQVMLTDGIASAYHAGCERVAAAPGTTELLRAASTGRGAAPSLYRTSGRAWLDNEALAEEVFGPLGILVTVSDADEMIAIAMSLHGQLTCGLHLSDVDMEDALELLPILERKAGRLLANGFPTGVEVSDAMVHGGPYPASTNFGATSVGTLSIRRFLRPVCYQNMPQGLLPADLVSGG